MAALMLAALVSPATAQDWRMCYPGERNGPQKRCVVDGDTIRLGGMDQSLRLKDFDTPEPKTGICGGAAEVELANRASARLLQLLNNYDWTVEIFDPDRTGRRLEATIRIDGIDVGDILIAEGRPVAGRTAMSGGVASGKPQLTAGRLADKVVSTPWRRPRWQRCI